jgi:hypothetical protein
MKLDEQYNRPDRYGAFGGWEYDPETKTQQYVATSPGMQAAQERMDRRLGGEGFTPYQAPEQVGSIMDALMADKMERMGLMDKGVADLKQDSYGTRFNDRPGSGYQSGQPPQGAITPPPQPPITQPPPQDTGDPPPGNQRPPVGGRGVGDLPPGGRGGGAGGGNRGRLRPRGMGEQLTPEEMLRRQMMGVQ